MRTDSSQGLDGPEINADHLSTEHLEHHLKSRIVSSGLVATLAQAAQFVLNLVAIMILARLLRPRDFGLVAMAMAAMAFLRIFKDAGLSTVTIQRDGISHAQVSNLFWTNVAMSVFAGVVMAVSAPLLAWFYGEPALVAVTMALAATFVLTGLGTQHLAILTRQLRVETVALIRTGSALVGTSLGIVLAWRGCGVWSLVAVQIATPLVSLLLTWRVMRWRPQWVCRRAETRSLLGFGANITASALIYSLARGADSLLIGRYYGSDVLGVYSRAAALLMRPIEQFTSPMEAVFVPALSRLQRQPERYRRMFLQVHDAIALVAAVAVGLLTPLAAPLVLVVLGPQWERGGAIFAALSVGAWLIPVGSVCSWLFLSHGRGGEWLLTSSVASVVMIASLLIGMPFGPEGVAISYSAASLVIVLPLLYHMAGRQGPVRAAHLWLSLLRHLPVCGVVFAATTLVDAVVVSAAPLARLVISVPVGLLTGMACVGVFAPARRTVTSFIRVMRGERSAGARRD